MTDISQKMEILSQEFPEEFSKISSLFDNMYRQIIKQRKKTSFEAFGKKYQNPTFTKNYIAFCNDVSKIQDASFFERILGNKKATSNLNNFSISTINDNAYERLNNGVFISKDIKIDIQINNINLLCKELNINVKFNF